MSLFQKFSSFSIVYSCLNISFLASCVFFIAVLCYGRTFILFKVEERKTNFLRILVLFLNILVIISYIAWDICVCIGLSH
jgi:hypothetical protein